MKRGPLQKAVWDVIEMTEERKFTILFAATILAARTLIQMEPDKPNMAKDYGRA